MCVFLTQKKLHFLKILLQNIKLKVVNLTFKPLKLSKVFPKLFSHQQEFTFFTVYIHQDEGIYVSLSHLYHHSNSGYIFLKLEVFLFVKST